MDVSFTAIETEVLQAGGIMLMAGVGWVVKRVLTRLGYQETAAQQQAFDVMGTKVMDYAVSKASAMIKAKGWDHADVKSAILATAAQQAIDKFPDAMKNVGIDPSDPQAISRLTDGLLERKFPEAMEKAALSPATPPAPSAGLAVPPGTTIITPSTPVT